MSVSGPFSSVTDVQRLGSAVRADAEPPGCNNEVQQPTKPSQRGDTAHISHLQQSTVIRPASTMPSVHISGELLSGHFRAEHAEPPPYQPPNTSRKNPDSNASSMPSHSQELPAVPADNRFEQSIWEDSWDFVPSRQPTPEPEPEKQRQPFNIFGHTAETKAAAKTRVIPQDIVAQTHTARNPDASRTCPQFVYQLSQECVWLRFEIFHKRCTLEGVDINMLAYCNIKRFWQESFIWDEDWDDVPGDTWMHEPETDH
ncbi:hypothetical protein B0J12DRAFT_733491 [Macrophomina phaseolina]|uniref:Uncharacterized protein n=1 Tax=Macrophomina phaseolina TaxID=35725 RepID=A0ABQ8FRI9_9PEZI|nr:hypothetical protein B0J12DRAFT_733491 [Macrophomina phaseolina]